MTEVSQSPLTPLPGGRCALLHNRGCSRTHRSLLRDLRSQAPGPKPVCNSLKSRSTSAASPSKAETFERSTTPAIDSHKFDSKPLGCRSRPTSTQGSTRALHAPGVRNYPLPKQLPVTVSDLRLAPDVRRSRGRFDRRSPVQHFAQSPLAAETANLNPAQRAGGCPAPLTSGRNRQVKTPDSRFENSPPSLRCRSSSESAKRSPRCSTAPTAGRSPPRLQRRRTLLYAGFIAQGLTPNQRTGCL